MTRPNTRIALLNAQGQPIEVGAKITQPCDRRRAVIGGWDPVTREVLIWTVPARVGDVRHLTPWPAESLGLAWSGK
jgi:hypothetical protein